MAIFSTSIEIYNAICAELALALRERYSKQKILEKGTGIPSVDIHFKGVATKEYLRATSMS